MKLMDEILSRLAHKRPVFHSEADFQFSIAWELHQQLEEPSIRLEFPFSLANQSQRLDIWVECESTAIAIELKYKTRALTTAVDGEKFALNNQAAQNHGRYDFINDIQRLERIIYHQDNIIGYAIILTNDEAYWKRPKSNLALDTNFRIHHGRTLEGSLSWKPGLAPGAIRYREKVIDLQGIYSLQWCNYSRLCSEKPCEFRSLTVKVSK